MWSWLKSVWFQVTLGSCFSFLYSFFTDHEDRGPVLLDDYPFASWASIGRVYAW